jgi:integrase
MRGYGKKSPVAANRCLSTLRLALSWAVETGYLENNPAEGLTRRVAGGEEVTQARVLNDDEIRALWKWDHAVGRLCRFLLCTGLRIQEAQRAQVAHVAGERLTIPAEHTKNGRPHWIFLTAAALEQVEPGAAPRLFTAVSPTMAQHSVRRRQGEDTPNRWTPHDLRRTFATRMGHIGIAPHVIEKCLNHTAEGVAAIYNRAELEAERVAAFQLWGAELQRLLTPKAEVPSAEVVKITRKRRHAQGEKGLQNDAGGLRPGREARARAQGGREAPRPRANQV